jgi:Ca-activated chloride channel family protein
MSAVSFGYPAVLALAAIFITFAAWALARDLRDHRKRLAAFGEESLFAQSSTLPTPRSRLVGQALPAAAVVLGLLALARPQWGERPTALGHSGRDLLVALDLSRSMNAVDGGPEDGLTRLEIAKRAISQVLASLPEDRAGLIVFGGSAFLQLPLTGNHAAFRRFLDAATTDDLGDPATDISSALSAAATAFEHEGEPGYQSILIASDGESVGGDVGPPLARLKSAGVPVFSIGVGSAEGAPVPADSSEAPEKWHRDHIGRIVVSRLEEGDLRRAARETGGDYVRATAEGIERLSGEIKQMQKRLLSSRDTVERVDRFQWPLALALVALFAAPAAAVSGLRKRK